MSVNEFQIKSFEPQEGPPFGFPLIECFSHFLGPFDWMLLHAAQADSCKLLVIFRPNLPLTFWFIYFQGFIERKLGQGDIKADLVHT